MSKVPIVRGQQGISYVLSRFAHFFMLTGSHLEGKQRGRRRTARNAVFYPPGRDSRGIVSRVALRKEQPSWP